MVSRLAVLPSVNRNCSRVLDHNGSGLIVYASRSNIYVLDLRSLPPVVLDKKVLRNCHSKKAGRILALSCCKGTFPGVVTSGDDSHVKIWNLETASCAASVETFEASHIVEWLYDSVTSVVFCHQKTGVITKWNFSSNSTVKLKTATEASINVISSNPKLPEFLAVGHSNGMISIMNVVTHVLVRKLKTHSLDITSFCWSPVLPDVLLSTSLDMSARVWKLNEDKPTKTYYYPQSRYKVDDKSNLKICGIFHPKDPDTIIISNVRGDLGSVTFKDNEMPKFTRYSIDGGDTNYKFVNIMQLYYDEKDGKRRDLLLSVDHMKIAIWDITKQILICGLYFTTGQIIKFSLSMLNSNYMAICISDGTLKVWNVASEENMQMASIYIHHKVRITSAAWHPTEENILAYGTNEGRVGVIDTYKRRSMYAYEAYHERTVYTVGWGPCCKIKGTDEKFFLYSCGGKVIHIDELNKPKQKPLDFFTMIEAPEGLESAENSLSEFSWRVDYSCIAVGCAKGFIDLFTDEFKFLARFTMQVPTVEFLQWHPALTSESPEGSPYKTWLAVSGNYTNIHIVDVADSGGQFETTLCKPKTTLIGHKERVSTICWSPHTNGRLASASKDGSVQIWDVITNTRIANYVCHVEYVSAVQWSVFDPDVIYSGGGDSCLRIWNISQQTQSELAAIAKNRGVRYKTGVKKIHCESELASRNVASEPISTTSQEVAEQVAPKKEEIPGEDRRDLPMRLKSDFSSSKKVRSLFLNRLLKSYTAEGYLEGIIRITDYLCTEGDDSNLENSNQLLGDMKEEQDAFIYGLFTNQMAALKMLEMRTEYEKKGAQLERATCVQIMACDTESLIKEAAEKSKLTDFHVSMAPSVSYGFWLEMCEKYAMQLIEEEQYIKGGMYLITCGKVYEAINVLSEKGLDLDALALAKSRLPESDPVIRVLLHKASMHFFKMHQKVEAEALCHVALKDPLSAAKVLYCINNSKSMYAAAYVCKKFKLKEAEDYAYLCMEKCLSQNDWPTFYRLLEHFENLQVYKAFVRVHELIAGHLKVLKREDGVFVEDIFGKNGSRCCIWNGKISESGQTILAHICDVLKSDGVLPDDKDTLESILKAVDTMDTKRRKFEADAEAHVCVALCATKVIASSLLEKKDQAKIFFCQIFSSSYNIVFLPKVVCWLFLPFDVYYCTDARKFSFDMKSNYSLPFETHFQNMYETLQSKFANINHSVVEDFSIEDLQSSLKATIEKVATVLSKKCVEDSVLLYFVASYLNELQRRVKKGWKYMCFKNIIAEEINKSEKDAVKNSQNICNSNQNGDAMKHGDTTNGEQNSDNNQSEVEKLIHIVYAEAEEKSRKIVESKEESKAENGTTTVDRSVFSLSPDEVSDYCLIENEEGITDSEKRPACTNSDEISCDEIRENDAVSNSSCDIFNELPASTTCENCNNNMRVDSPEILQQNMPPETDVHQQCWNEVSFCYDLMKSLISVICKDEYAALYYLELYLCELNKTLADIARTQSKISINTSITNICKRLSADVEKNVTKLENQEQIKLNENDIKCNEVPSDAKEVHSSVDEVQIKVEDNIDYTTVPISAKTISEVQEEIKPIEDGIVNHANIDENFQNCDTVHISEVNSSSNVVLNGVDKLDLELVENDVEDSLDSEDNSNDKYGAKVSANETVAGCSKIDSDSDMLKKNSELEIKTVNGENTCSTFQNGVTVSDIAHDDSMDVKDKKLEITILKEWISNQIKILKSQEFCYPNPFDAVTNVNGICYSIFHKHPCEFVKTKFHELSHKTNEWNNKFKTEATYVSCDICEKEVKQNSL